MYHILLIDDSREICEELSILLRANGYEVSALQNFSDIPSKVSEISPDLVLLDVNLPGEDGYRLCERIRKCSSVPVIFVTSRNTEMDELMSISIGGDDFITKPYHTPILLARISALLKRAYRGRNDENALTVRGVALDSAMGKVGKDGKTEELTKNEWKILSYLMKNAGRIVSRTELVEFLWDNEMYVDENTLSVNMTRIRGKLSAIGAKDFITTKRGMGYLI